MSSGAKSRPKTRDGIALAALAGVLLLMLVQHALGDWRGALLVTIGFAVGGWLLRGVNPSGALAGGLVAFILYARGGWRMFAVLFAVFALTLCATAGGRGRKQALGLAEHSGGRSAAQVAANLFVAAAALVMLPATVAAVVAVAALAEAAADTVSSEMGEAFGTQTYLVTTLRPTAPGTNGGVSLIGTLAGIGAAAIVVATGSVVIGREDAVLAGAAGVIGMTVDSVLGATLENKGYLNNEAVNGLGTASAAVVAFVVCQL